MRYLSPEWIAAAARAVAASTGLKEATLDMALTVEQVVTDTPDGTVRWHLAIDHGRVELVAGPAPAPDLRFTTSYPVAAAIASGAVGAQRAFAEGWLQVGGRDLSLLTAHQRAFGSFEDALTEVRAATTYEGADIAAVRKAADRHDRSGAGDVDGGTGGRARGG